MKISPLKLAGTLLLEQQPYCDERGSFARQFCQREMAAAGVDFQIRQCNISQNRHSGTLRGLHYQRAPYPEAKIVSCLKGRVYDVQVDLRVDSPTYLQWQSCELSESGGLMIYMPPGIAHGFQTLEDDSTVFYQLNEFFVPDSYAGVRWNDPKLGIVWPPCARRFINDRDANYELI